MEKKYVTDPYGNKFKSIKEMCEHYKVSNDTYNYRIKLGWTQEEALGIIDKLVATDPLGNRFKNILEMCKHYNIKYKLYKDRIKSGWTQEEALGIVDRTEYINDISGNKFKSIVEMCEHYKISYDVYKWRKKYKYDKVLCITDTNKFRICLGFIGIDNKAYYTIRGVKDRYYTVSEILKMCNSSLLEDYLRIHPDEKYDPYDV